MEWLIIALLVANLALMAYFFTRPKEERDDSQSMMLLQNQMEQLARSVENKLGEGTDRMFQGMRAQSDQSQRLITNIQEVVARQLQEVVRGQTQTNEATNRFVSIAEQLSNLEKTLTHQKQRGNWGEASLELILGGFLPPNAYKIQHRFSDDDIVDAAIITKDGLLPVDAKFSLDNYNRLVHAEGEDERTELEKMFKNDLKLRIDETAKYVRPKEGTLPIAFMYIPAEAIYYDLLVGEVNAGKVNARNLIDYAYKERRVIIVSPTTFMAYLAMVKNGLDAYKVEQNAKDIQKNIDALGKHMKAWEDYYKKLGASLSTTVNHYNAAGKELGKIDKDVLKISGSSPELEAMQIERPTLLGAE
jgi:DNA recombination protein RmuC